MRRLLVGAVIAATLLGVGIHLLLGSLSFERLRPILEQQLSEAVGLEVRLSGELELELLPRPHFEAEQITVANLPGRPSPHLLTIERLNLDFRLWPLLRRRVSIDTIEIYGAELRIEPDTDGTFALSLDVEELDEQTPDPDAGALELHLSRLYLENARVFYDRIGEDDVTTFVFDVLQLETEDLTSPVSLTLAGELEGGTFEVEARVGSLAELLEPTQPYPLTVQGRVLETELELSGTLASPTGLTGIDVAFSARIDDPGALIRDPDRRFPELGSIHASGRLRDPGGTLGVDDLMLSTGRDQPFRIVLEGSVRDLIAVEGVELQLRVEADDTEFLEAAFGTSLPDVPISADLHLSDDDGSLGTEGEATAGEGPIKLHLQGAYDDLRSLAELDVNVRLTSDDLNVILRTFEIELARPLPRLSPLEVSANLRDFDGTFGLDEIHATAGRREATWAEVTGSVRDVLALRGVRLDARFGSDSLKVLEASLGRELPALGKLEGSFLVRDADGSLGVEQAHLKLGRPELLELELSGRFDDLRELDEIEVEMKLEARDLAVLGELAELELPAVGPVTYAGRVRGSDERLVWSGSLRLNRTVLNGEWTVVFAPELRPSLSGQIRSPNVFLADLGVAPNATRLDLPGREEAASAFQRWWSRGEPAPLEVLRGFDLDVVLDANRVSGRRGFDIRDLHAEVRLDDGDLVLRDVTASYDGGRVEGALRVDARRADPLHTFTLEAFNVDMTTLASQFQQSTDRAGTLDLSINLASRGWTRPEILAGLNGHLGAMLRDGALVDRYSRAFSVSFLRVSVPDFRTGAEAATEVKCLIAFLPVEAGIAEIQKLYLEGANITIEGSGAIDLAGNALDLRLTPHLHEPGLVSVAVTVDISGPMNAPSMRPLRRSLGASLVRGLVSNAMRPKRALGRRLRADSTRADPCDLVRLRRDLELQTTKLETEAAAFRAPPDEG